MASTLRTVGTRTATVTGEMLLTFGVLVFLFIVWQFFWTDLLAHRSNETIRNDLTQNWSTSTPAPTPQTLNALPVDPPEQYLIKDVPIGEAFAVLHIPRFSEYWGNTPRPIVSGTAKAQIDVAVGHYQDTQGPGEIGNFALAGHRTTFGGVFYHLEKLQPGDAIVIETQDAWFTYHATEARVGTPTDVAAIAPVPDQPGVLPTTRSLTITTCHPRTSMKQRYIQFATLHEWRPRSAGPPPAVRRTTSSVSLR